MNKNKKPSWQQSRDGERRDKVKTWKWIAILAIGLLVVLIVGAFLFRGVGYHWMPMHGRFGGIPMMGASRYFGFGVMLFGLLVPLLLLGLVITGGVAIYNGLKKPAASAPVSSCSHCGKPIQADWVNCPYCGEKL